MSQKIKRYGIPVPVTAITLIFGGWKNLFTAERFKILIATCLNYSVTDKKGEHSVLSGYQISTSKLHLVFRLEEAAAKKHLLIFREKLERELRHEIDQLKNTAKAEDQKTLLMKIDLFPHRFFDEQNLIDGQLIRLLTGQPVELPYYSPQLERLKRDVFSSRFCSTIDYTGATGPVCVTLVKSNSEETL
ncbi:MAG: hypothetical protein HYZ14_07320 [Bacteroidetes bacterium]|nr:hypothetical protein [Bacteroidota bacterium]